MIDAVNHIQTPLVGLDAHIESMRQTLYSNLEWLDDKDSYGLAQRKRAENSSYYPSIYKGEGEHYDLSVNSNKKSESFFYIRSYFDALYKTENQGRTSQYKTEFSLTININVDLIRESLQSEYSLQEYIRQVLKVEFSSISEGRDVKIKKVIFNKFSEIYEDFTFWQLNQNYTFHPQNAFRVFYEMKFGIDCTFNNLSKTIQNYEHI